VVVPNSVVGAVAVLNKRKDVRPEACEVSIQLAPEAAVDWARSILLKGLKASGPVLEHPAPEIVVTAAHNWGVEYGVHFHFDSSQMTLAKARDSVLTTVLDQLQRHGLKLAAQKHQILMSQEAPPARRP